MSKQWNLNDIKKGLTANPRYVSQYFHWETPLSHDLYHQRRSRITMYQLEEDLIEKSVKEIACKLTDKVVVVDLGAGLTSHSTNMISSLTEEFEDRKIAYVPVDDGEHIYSLPTFLEEQKPGLRKHIVAVKPLSMDMLEATRHITSILTDTPYSSWEIIFTLYGPATSTISNSYFVQLVSEVGKVINQKGKGGIMFTYIPSYNGIEEVINREYISKVDIFSMMKCVLLGFNAITGADINPEQFYFEKEFKEGLSTPGISGNWSGVSYKAISKQQIEIKCKKLKVNIELKKGECIRLSEDVVKGHYYEDSFITSLAEKASLKVKGKWSEEYITNVFCVL